MSSLPTTFNTINKNAFSQTLSPPIMAAITLILTLASSAVFVFILNCCEYAFKGCTSRRVGKSMKLKHLHLKDLVLALQKSKQQHHQQQQQQQQHSILVTIIIGLFFSCICVSGQIDGYLAGIDYPTYDAIPKGLSFNCQGRLPGYYADIETRCQVWHWCLHSGHQYSFLCPNGTVFNQAVRVCDWWSNVNCPASEQLYQNNEELYRIEESRQGNNI